jgi:hypothetical protein
VVARIHRLGSRAIPIGLAAFLALAGPASAADLVHWWKADGDFADAVAGNDGSPVGDTTFGPGQTGMAFSFDGNDDYVSVPDAASHLFDGSFSIDAWVSTTSDGIVAAYYDCAQFCPGNPSLYELVISSGKGYGVVRDAAAMSGDTGQRVTGGPEINDGRFHHVSLVRDVEAATLTVYVDYVLAGEELLEAQSDGPIANADSEADPLTIGAQFEGGTSDPKGDMTGLVDELRLWNGANHPPRPTGAPTIAGSAVEGETLTCAPGDWSGSPTFSFEWLRDGSPIGGASAATYTLTTADVGRAISCRVTATNTGGSPKAISSAVTPAATPGPPPPVGPLGLDDLQPLTDGDVGRIAQAAPKSGVVLISLDGKTFVPLDEAGVVPVGAIIDTRKGTVRLRTATGSGDSTQTGDFGGGLFQVLQSRSRSARGLTDLVLKGGSFRGCGARGARDTAGAALSRRVIRRLRSDAGGRFRTRGRNSSATVRGTVWITTDRCDGTLTQVRRGRVVVRELRRKRTVVVSRGESYLARAR